MTGYSKVTVVNRAITLKTPVTEGDERNGDLDEAAARQTLPRVRKSAVMHGLRD